MGSVKQPSLSGELSEWLRPGQGRGREGWGLQGDQEALPLTWRQLSMPGTARIQTGDSGPWGEGSSPVSTSEAPSPEGEEADCPGRGHKPLYPLPGLGCIVLAAAQSVRACFRSAVGCSRCPPRPHELTFTKLSASGKPGSTISPSDLAALVADWALDSRGLGGAIYPAGAALLARMPRPARRARTALVRRQFLLGAGWGV